MLTIDQPFSPSKTLYLIERKEEIQVWRVGLLEAAEWHSLQVDLSNSSLTILEFIFLQNSPRTTHQQSIMRHKNHYQGHWRLLDGRAARVLRLWACADRHPRRMVEFLKQNPYHLSYCIERFQKQNLLILLLCHICRKKNVDTDATSSKYQLAWRAICCFASLTSHSKVLHSSEFG